MNSRIFMLIICLVLLNMGGGCQQIPKRSVLFYDGDGGGLQALIDSASPGDTVRCDPNTSLTLSTPLNINKPLMLKGLHARLPEGLGDTSLIIVNAPRVILSRLQLHGNYDSVDQDNRAPLIKIHAGGFRIEDCNFYDASKDGIEICPVPGQGDLVGGLVKSIQAFRIGRDAVSITGGNEGQRVRNVVVENVTLQKGYLRGAVEVSDGTDNITVRNVYAEDAVYAIDVQDHRRNHAPNTQITVHNVTAVNCKHVIRTQNSDLGHADLFLSKFTADRCEQPVRISHTRNVKIDGLRILNHRSAKHLPIVFKNCQDISLDRVSIETVHFYDQPIQTKNCKDIQEMDINKKRIP